MKVRNVFFFFYEEQHSGIALLLDRDEKIISLVHTKAMNLCSLFSRKKTSKIGCACIPEIRTELWEVRKSVNVLPVLRITVVKPS